LIVDAELAPTGFVYNVFTPFGVLKSVPGNDDSYILLLEDAVADEISSVKGLRTLYKNYYETQLRSTPIEPLSLLVLTNYCNVSPSLLFPCLRDNPAGEVKAALVDILKDLPVGHRVKRGRKSTRNHIIVLSK
jgi:hypothetical protein